MMSGNDTIETNLGNRTRSSAKRSVVFRADGISNLSVDGHSGVQLEDDDKIIEQLNKEVENYKYIENLRNAFVYFICEIRSLNFPFFNRPSATILAFRDLLP